MPNLLVSKPNAHSVLRLLLESSPLYIVFPKSSSRLGKGIIKFGFRGKASSTTKYNGIIIFVTGIFLIGGTFKSPELNAFPKLELLKTLLSFSRPWAPTSISVKQQFASAAPNKFIE
jgi:hypothetical protein